MNIRNMLYLSLARHAELVSASLIAVYQLFDKMTLK